MAVEYKAMKDTDGFYYVEDSNGVVYRNTKSIALSDARDKALVHPLRMQLSTFAGRLAKVERLDTTLYHVQDEAMAVLCEVADIYLAGCFVDEDVRESAAVKLGQLLRDAVRSSLEQDEK